MIGVRLAFYVLYVALGIVMLVRLTAGGLRGQAASGIVLALAFVALGLYRIRLFMRSSRQR